MKSTSPGSCLRFVLAFAMVCAACSSSSMSLADGAADALDGGAAGMYVGPDGWTAGVEVGGGGTGGPVDAKALDGTPGVDAVVEGDGGACASGLPETGMVVRPMCTRSMVATGGTVPDGHYQLVAISALAACFPLELPPPQSSAFTVAGKNVVGVDGLIGDTGAITTWRHWRAQMNYVDNRINLTFQCGTSINPIFFAVVDDGVILIVDKGNSGHAYRFKRL